MFDRNKNTLSFFEELKRRNVFRVGIAYVVSTWLLLQVADVVLNNFEAPAWLFRTILLVLVIGLPVALLLAWAFELTPEGIRKENEVDRSQSVTPTTARKLDRGIIVALTLALGLFAIDKFVLDPARDQALAEAAAEKARNEIPAATISENSIAVLPFVDLSETGDQQYFSDGIAEELLNALVRVDGLKVASRTSSFTFRGNEQNLRDIAAALQVSLILEGSVRRVGKQVRISAQLIDTRSDRHLWSETYDRDLNDVLGIQVDIAKSIVSSMKHELGLDISPEQVAITTATESIDAYDLYLHARSLIIARADISEAIELLKQAVAIDPGFAKAWEVLGVAYYIGPTWGYDVGDDHYNQSIAASERALELDDSLALAISLIGSVGQTVGTLSYEAALDYDRRAIEADKYNATVQLWSALRWADLGFFDQAVSLLERCLEIDPGYGNCKRHLAGMKLATGDEDLALKLFQEGSEDGFIGNEALFVPLVFRHQGRAAAGYVAGRLTSEPGFPVRDLLDTLQFPQRDHSAAHQRYRARIDEFEWHNLSNDPIVAAYFDFFERYEHVIEDTAYWIWSPDLAHYRQSPVFKQHIARLGQEEYWRQHGFPPMCRSISETDYECD